MLLITRGTFQYIAIGIFENPCSKGISEGYVFHDHVKSKIKLPLYVKHNVY